MKHAQLFLVARRRMLQQLAGVMTVSALPLRSRAASAPVSEVMTTMSTYMSGAAARALPDDVVEQTKQHIMDTFAAMVSGVELKPAELAFKFARAHQGEKVCTVVASNILCGPLEAALANGILSHSDETDDSHAPSHSHPGCSVVPATLAAGEQFGISGERFVRAVALGYDIGTRVNMTLGGLPYQMQTHRSMHSMCGNFGSAAAAGCAASLNAHQMRWLLDYTTQQTGATAAWERDTEHVEKALVFAGFPARNGVSAALLIQLGGSGVEDILSGSDNFLQTFAPQADPSKLIDKLGERYEVTRTNIKKWTTGSPIQAPLDALVNLRQKRNFDADEVRSIVVRVATSEANTVNNRDIPDICLQHMVAVMLIDKTVTFKSAHDAPRMRDAQVLKQRAKVTLTPDDELEKLYPQRITVVEVTFNDGSMLTERVADVRGTAENPMTHDEVVAKTRELCAPTLGKAQTEKLLASLLKLETLPDVRALRPLLQKSAAHA